MRNPLLEQSEDLLLVPLNGFGIREIENRILYRHSTCSIHYMETFLDDLWEEAVLGSEIRQLPQTSMETVFCQLLQHLHWVLEAVL